MAFGPDDIPDAIVMGGDEDWKMILLLLLLASIIPLFLVGVVTRGEIGWFIIIIINVIVSIYLIKKIREEE